MKVFTFVMLFCMHLLLVLLLIWRFLSGSMRYSPIFSKAKPTPWYWIFVHLCIDSLLYTNVWPVVYKFFAGYLWFRLRYGFREIEIIFRTPTGESRALLANLPDDQRETEYTNKLYRAIDQNLVYQCSSYITQSDNLWVLEYEAPLEAHARAKSGDIDIKKWDLSVWQKPGEDWTVWEVWPMHLPGESKRIAMFKAKLESRKADLFNRWKDFMNSAAFAPDGSNRPFTVEVSQAIVDMFQKEGIDYAVCYEEAISSPEFA